MLVAAMLAIAISVTVVFPRAHYLLIPAGMLVIGLVVAQYWIGSSRYSLVIPVAIAVALFSLFALQSARFAIGRAAYPAPLAAAASRMAETKTAWRLLAVDWGLAAYVPGLEQVDSALPQPNESFAEFLTRNGINAVIINDRFSNSAWSTAPGFAEFVADPISSGFTPVVPGSSVYVHQP
jgi:hypothetical protein